MFEGELACQAYLPVNLEMLLRYFQNYFQSIATGQIFWKIMLLRYFQNYFQSTATTGQIFWETM